MPAVASSPADNPCGSILPGPIHIGARYTAEVNGLGTMNILEAIRLASGATTSTSGAGGPRFYQASTSELFGGRGGDGPLNEDSPFRPRSPYGYAKLMAYWCAVMLPGHRAARLPDSTPSVTASPPLLSAAVPFPRLQGRPQSPGGVRDVRVQRNSYQS